MTWAKFYRLSTLQFFALGAGVITLAAYCAWPLLPVLTAEFPPVRYYFPTFGLWSLVHLVYLVWYFGTRRDERAIMRVVADAYGTRYEQA